MKVHYLKDGDTIQKKQHSLLNRASEASNVLKKHIENNNVIRIISHNDADGISAAAVLANALKEENVQFHTTIVPRLKEDLINQLRHEKHDLVIFSDMGSSFVGELNSFKCDVIIADHHQVSDVEAESNVVHINPHLFDIDGSRDLSGAGSSYLAVRDLDKKHLAYFALIGAFGDMQGQDGFTGVNKLIVDDVKQSGNLEIHDGLKIVSKSSEPLFKSLAYTFSPPLPGITGDLEEYSYILDACGKNKKFGLGLSIALGEREKALKTATDLQRKYRDQLVKGLEWIKREGSVNLSHIQYLYSEDKVLKSVMGTIASIGLSINLLDDSKPVLGLSRLHKDIKVSGRTTRQQVEKGVNLGKALQDSSNNFGGQGGGYDIAAGAMIPFDSKDNFLNLVNDMVEYQINND